MRRSNIPSDIKIALDNLRRAYIIRTKLEHQLLERIRNEVKLQHEVCVGDEPYEINLGALAREVTKIIKALLIEYDRVSELDALRKAKKWYE